jgi:hypothetical protein
MTEETTTAHELFDASPFVEEPASEESAEKINLSELSETLNGYDQIAIRTRFHERFDQLAEDPIMFARAMYFIHLRRGGAKDAQAHEAAMRLPMKEVNELFETSTDTDEFEGDETATQERDKQFADFIVGTGISYTLDEYMALTISQRAAIIEAANRR